MSYAYQCTSWMMIHSHVQRHVQIEVFLNAQKLIWTCRQSYCKLYVNFVTYSQWTYKYKTDNKRKDSKKSEDTANERERESVKLPHQNNAAVKRGRRKKPMNGKKRPRRRYLDFSVLLKNCQLSSQDIRKYFQPWRGISTMPIYNGTITQQCEECLVRVK